MSSNYSEYVVGRRAYGKNTQAFGTAITQLIEPWQGAVTEIDSMMTTTLTTAHLLTLMRPLAKVYFAADAAAAQAATVISADPGAYAAAAGAIGTADNAISANDNVVYQAADGTYVLDTVAVVAGLTVTLTGNLPTGGVKAGGSFWFYGLVTDTNPSNRQAHPRWNLNASTINYFGPAVHMSSIPGLKGLNLDSGAYHPLVVHIDNGTAASIIESVGVKYVSRSASHGRP